MRENKIYKLTTKICLALYFILTAPDTNAARRLNNLVTELFKKEDLILNDVSSFDFENPRDGWIFVSSTTDIEDSSSGHMYLDNNKSDILITHKKTDTDAEITKEAMRWLRAGKYVLFLHPKGRMIVKSLIVRTVPEIIYVTLDINLEYNPIVTKELLGWKFLKKHRLLRNYNVMTGDLNIANKPLRKYWKSQGKKWVTEIYGYGHKKWDSADQLYSKFANAGFNDLLCDGVLVSEFGATNKMLANIPVYLEMMKMIDGNEFFSGKVFYPYVGTQCINNIGRDMPLSLEPFLKGVFTYGHKVCRKRYLWTSDTLEAAKKTLDIYLREDMLNWRKAHPTCEQDMILCLGYFSTVPEQLSIVANADFKVFMDMEFNMVANDPAFEGLGGIMEYLSPGYVDEEVLRWAGQLFRHYCIEGKTIRLSKDPYLLSHIENGDFTQPIREWSFLPANKGTILAGHEDRLGWQEGRYHMYKTYNIQNGNDFLITRRSDVRPNAFSQKIKALEPGRLYSLRMFTSDYKKPCLNQKHTVSIHIDNVDFIPEKTRQIVYRSIHKKGVPENKRRYFNYHYRVFRSRSRHAKLTISDWINKQVPGGPVGQELLYNFVMVQPYFKE